MTIKYLICPGSVTSKVDGQVHFIAAAQLMQLYRVDPRQCMVQATKRSADGYPVPPNLIQLHPRYDGNYTLPEGEQT